MRPRIGANSSSFGLKWWFVCRGTVTGVGVGADVDVSFPGTAVRVAERVGRRRHTDGRVEVRGDGRERMAAPREVEVGVGGGLACRAEAAEEICFIYLFIVDLIC